LTDGYAKFLLNLMAMDSVGNNLQLEDLGEARWRIESLGATPVTLKYGVALSHDQEHWPWGPDEAPYAKDDCVFWTGRSLFLVSGTNDITVRFEVPRNWHVSVPWQPAESTPHTFFVKTEEELTDAFILAGTHSESLSRVGEAQVLLAVGGQLQESKQKLQATTERFLSTYDALFGGTPEARMLIAANPYDKPGSIDAGVFGRSISLLMGDPVEDENKAQWAPIIGHELFHIWNGQALEFEDQEYWFMEGFTSYYALVASARLGFIGEDDFLRSIEGACRSYLPKAGQVSVRGAGDATSSAFGMVYFGGCLTALTLDIEIRRLTQGKRSLDDLMRTVYQEFGTTRTKYSVYDVIRAANTVSGTDMTGFFEKHVLGTDELPLKESLEHAGLSLDMRIGKPTPDRSYVIHDLLRIQSLTRTDSGFVIRRSTDAGYEDEDRLIAIEGTPVKTYDDLVKSVDGLKPGDAVQLTLIRQGEESAMVVTLAGTEKEIPLERPVEVTVTKKEFISETERSILTGILGD
jgi:predicted metalloprotease with PDZ domain